MPAGRVVGEVGIDECVPEPSLALLPTNKQILNQKRGGNHAHPVVHPSCRPEFAHASVHDGKTGPTTLPSLEMFLVFLPREFRKLFAKWDIGKIRPVNEQMVGKLAPS